MSNERSVYEENKARPWLMRVAFPRCSLKGNFKELDEKRMSSCGFKSLSNFKHNCGIYSKQGGLETSKAAWLSLSLSPPGAHNAIGVGVPESPISVW